MAIETSRIPKAEIELFKQLKDLQVIFDVGARIDTDYLEIWPESQHHLFEPNPSFFAELKEKVKDKPNVFVNNFGLGDRERKMTYQNGLQSFVESWAIDDAYASGDQTLSLKTLDGYIREKGISRIDFLKSDTEGFELKVFLGATNWFYIIKYIQYEHWGDANDRVIRGLLSKDFDCEYVGYRNVLCMNRSLVDETERNRLKEYIQTSKLGDLA